MKISATDTICLSSDAISTESEGEVVALSIERGRCYGMNSVGSRIWRKLGAPLQVSEVVNQTQAEFRIADPATSGREILDFLQQLADEGLIETSGIETERTGTKRIGTKIDTTKETACE